MVEVTEADRERSAELAHALGISCEDFTSGAADILVKHLAAHREAAERAVVEWLRKQADELETELRASAAGSSEWFSLREQVEDHQLIADAIEAGQHRKENAGE